MNPEIRALFPCTRELAYLNTATYGPAPDPVREAVDASLDELSAGTGDWIAWEKHAEDARRRFAALLGVSPGEVSLLPAVSAAGAQVAASLDEPSRGRRAVVVGAGEFRSNLYPWLALEERGFEIRVLPFPEGRPALEELPSLVREDTALVALSSVQSATGHRLPLAPVLRACRDAGARLYLDATQHVGALPIDVDGVDHVAVAGYKWLFAPRGTAYLWSRGEHLPALRPIAPGWRTPRDPYAGYYGLPYDRAPDASRLDYSIPWHCWVGAAKGLELVEEIGVERIAEHALGLAGRFREGLREVGLAPLFPAEETSHIVGLAVENADEVSRALVARKVVAAVRDDYLRVAFALFNDESDVERALAALRESTGTQRRVAGETL